MANTSAIAAILRHWQRTIGGVRDHAAIDNKPTIFSVTTERGARFVLKQVGDIERAAHIESTYRVVLYLHAANVPVAVPVLSDDQQLVVHHGGSLYTLSPMLPHGEDEGVTISPEQVYLNLGRAVARLHRALASYPDEILSWHMDFAHRTLGDAAPLILAHLEAQEREHFDAALNDVEQDMRVALTGLPEQHIHGDCHGGNIIVHNGDVAGFIDLDHLPRAPRIYDISYLLADMVKSQIDTPAELEPWLQQFDRFIVGYEQIQPLTSHEKAAVWYGMLAVQMLFVYWFFIHHAPAAARKNLAAFHWIYRHKHAIVPAITGQRASE